MNCHIVLINLINQINKNITSVKKFVKFFFLLLFVRTKGLQQDILVFRGPKPLKVLDGCLIDFFLEINKARIHIPIPQQVIIFKKIVWGKPVQSRDSMLSQQAEDHYNPVFERR